MIPEELEKKIEEAIKEGKKPFFVNATAGTTVKGAFDPFEAIGKYLSFFFFLISFRTSIITCFN